MRPLPLWALSSGWEDVTATDVVAIVGVEAITAVVFFFAGAMAGSFLNVVLYRLPRRANLLWPPSSCPSCGRRIALADNVPVVGYLLLRGRCRRCKALIPTNYLRIEIGLGLASLAMLYLVLSTGGANLPLRQPNEHAGALWTVWYPQPDLLSIHGYFCLLSFFLICLCLFAWRGERLSGGVVAVALLAGVLLPLAGPHLQQVPLAGAEPADVGWRRAFGGGTEALLGVGIGAAIGAALAVAVPTRTAVAPQPGPRWALPTACDLPIVLALAGAWMGWQAAVSVAVLSAFAMACLPRAPALLLAAGAVAVQFAFWRLLTRYAPWWPGPSLWPPLTAGWAALAVVVSAARRLRGRDRRSAPGSMAPSGARIDTELPPAEPPVTPAAPAE